MLFRSPFDLGVVPVEVMQDAAARARFASGPTIDIAHVGLGVAVRAGAPKPEIGTAEAFKASLLKAQSVASIPESATGYSIARVFARLGITEAMQAKMKAQPNPAQVVGVVARGEVELGLFLINVLTAPGLDVVGPFPAELQETVMFTAALASETGNAAAAGALVEFLKSPAAGAIIKSKGMNPGWLGRIASDPKNWRCTRMRRRPSGPAFPGIRPWQPSRAPDPQ